MGKIEKAVMTALFVGVLGSIIYIVGKVIIIMIDNK